MQTLFIVDRPDAAYEVCTKFAPNCAESQSSAPDSLLTSQRQQNNQSSANIEQRSLSGRARAADTQASASSSSLRNFMVDAAGASSDRSAGRGPPMSRGDSGESLGNSDDEYYDSINSGDENEMTTMMPIETLTPKIFTPVFNREPGIDYPEVEENTIQPVLNTTTFSTIVNGVKIKSLPGPRGKIYLFFENSLTIIDYF